MKKNRTPEKLLPLVSKLSEAYTSKESTSISYDAAKQLMEAVLYCLDAYDKKGDLPPAPEDKNNKETQLFAHEETEDDLFFAYSEGYALVLENVSRAREIYNELILSFHSYGNCFLEDTIKKGMPSFFLYYDAKFNPQNQLLTLDYPTMKSTADLQGIDAIHRYLTYIQLEQLFLCAFADEYVYCILNRYHTDYKDLPVNLCELLSQHLLTCLLLEKPLTSTSFSKEDLQKATDYLLIHTRSQVETKLQGLAAFLVKNAYNDNQALLSYLCSGISDFTARLFHGVKYDCLQNVFAEPV